MNVVAVAIIAFGVVLLVVMQLCDRLPHRAFYSRRAFEPRPLTYAEQHQEPDFWIEPDPDPPMPPLRVQGQLRRPVLGVARELEWGRSRELERP